MTVKFLWNSLTEYSVRHMVLDYFAGVAEDIQLENGKIITIAIIEELGQKGSGRVYNWTKNRLQYRKYTRRGKTYEVKGRWKHRSSAPGEAPVVWTNAYRSSWQLVMWREGNSHFAAIKNPLWEKYGRRLEFGGWSRDTGRGRIYIAPRPHVRPAVRKAIKHIEWAMPIMLSNSIALATRRRR